MSTCYIVPAKKATVVTHAVTGAFTGEGHLNLILAKTNRLEIFLVTAEGLKPVQEVPIFGRIATLNLFRNVKDSRDSLLVVTAKYNLAVLSWNEGKAEVQTRASGCVSERVGRPSDTGIITRIHSSALIALRLYDGCLKLVEWEEDKDLRSFNVRVEDMNILDIQFLYSSNPQDPPQLVYIYQDSRGRHLKTIELQLAEKDVKVLSTQTNIESEAMMMIPVPAPAGGAIIFGQETIILNRPDNSFLSVSPPHLDHTQFNCFAKVDNDGQRFLVGDISGRLYMLLLEVNREMGAHAITDLKLEYLGETSIAECLVYLDNGVVFVGSRFGDSQLIRLHSEPLPEKNGFVSVLESHPNLGPIRDMVLVESDGLTHLITCSGGMKDGSLRVIRNGIGIEELASVDLPGVKGLFPLKINSTFDNYIVVALSHETHILMISGEELEDTQLNGMETEETTLWTGCTLANAILQVTPTSIRLAAGEDLPVIWHQPKNAPSMTAVSVNAETGQILAAAGAHLFYLDIVDRDIVLRKSIEMEHEIACVDMTPTEDGKHSMIAAVGLWKEMSAALLRVPDLVELSREKLGGDVVPRAVQLARMDNAVYLLAAMGDGTLLYYSLDSNGVLRDPKKATLGTQPTLLRRFFAGGRHSIFACSDRPAVLFSSAGKLVFSNVNLKQVTQMCTLDSATYRDCLVLSDGDTLLIGRMDDIQKLHLRTVPLGENATRIAHQSETGTLAILTYREENGSRESASRQASAFSSSRSAITASSAAQAESLDGDMHSVVILDHNTFEILHSHELRHNEHACSVLSATLGDDSSPYIIVGTALVLPDEAEPKQGRCIIFEVGSGEQRNSLRLIHEKEVKGAAYSLATLSGKLVVSVNSSVRLFEWTSEKELRLECSHFNYTTALFAKTKGDMLLVGDLMRSICLVSYKSMEGVFEEIARDLVCQWMSACEIMDSDTFLGAEASFNLFTAERDSNVTAGEERQKLHDVGAFYLGEMVNTFRRGSLVSPRTDSLLPAFHSILYGTVDGSIGQITQTDPAFFEFLCQVERAVAEKTTNCMRVDHSVYRTLMTERQVVPPHGFVDGELVESLLDMPRQKAMHIVAGIKLPDDTHDGPSDPEDILKMLEELARLH